MLNISYSDNGDRFTGDTQSLGKLFYKHNSPKGSGIGLYLVKNLMQQMKGTCDFISQDSLIIQLGFHYKKIEQGDKNE